MPSSHRPLSIVVVPAEAALFARFASLIALVAVALTAIAVPLPAHQSILTFIVKFAEVSAARADPAHVTWPVAPVAGVWQLQPAGALIEMKKVPAGVDVASWTPDAVPGPLFVTPSCSETTSWVEAVGGAEAETARSATGCPLHACIVHAVCGVVAT